MNLYNILALITIIIIIYSCSCFMNYKEGMKRTVFPENFDLKHSYK